MGCGLRLGVRLGGVAGALGTGGLRNCEADQTADDGRDDPGQTNLEEGGLVQEVNRGAGHRVDGAQGTPDQSAAGSGTDMVIANGDDVGVIWDILEGREVGTLFTAHRSPDFTLLDYIESVHP